MDSKARASGFGLSAALMMLVNAGLTIAKERSEGLKAWMSGFVDAHWVAHAVLILGLFIVLGFVFSSVLPRGRRPGVVLLARLLIVTTMLSSLAMALFFLFS